MLLLVPSGRKSHSEDGACKQEAEDDDDDDSILQRYGSNDDESKIETPNVPSRSRSRRPQNFFLPNQVAPTDIMTTALPTPPSGPSSSTTTVDLPTTTTTEPPSTSNDQPASEEPIQQQQPRNIDPYKKSATFRKLYPKLAPARLDQLTTIAKCPTKPEKPPPGACCGSSCDPCVLTLYGQELKIWKECQKEDDDEGLVDGMAKVTVGVEGTGKSNGSSGGAGTISSYVPAVVKSLIQW
ncbi:hypothetical protein HDU76_013425 [Blyttiomyces sp. JEL0837]|nr:hypothetical protein HDU76_013425 [Blyttiomyces sp. JEL0837]